MTVLPDDPAGARDGQGTARLQADDVRRRAKSGAALLVGRGVVLRGLGFVGSIVLARLLTPADFGVVAIGGAMVVFISLVSDGGLGAALIRGDHDPSRLVFEQLVGLQLVIAGAVTLGVLAVAPVFGQPAWVAAVMTSSLCIAVFGTASQIHLERHLMFRELATIDVAQSVAYLAWAIPAAMLGGGVWALATASVAQVVVATALSLRLASVAVPRPRFNFVGHFATLSVRHALSGDQRRWLGARSRVKYWHRHDRWRHHTRRLDNGLSLHPNSVSAFRILMADYVSRNGEID